MFPVSETSLPGVLLIDVPIYRDDRGHFLELWHRDKSTGPGLPDRLVQDNVSWSRRGVLRGLHFQEPHAQGKLVCVLEGSIHDVAVDIRVGSPTFGRWVGVDLDAASGRQIYVPEGFAHGFVVTSDAALVLYKCTETYRPGAEAGLLWSDPELAIDWPVRDPVLSAKDRAAPRLAELRAAGRLPRYAAGT
jgi:dTDP-4-dehydrorhamnose 3,5-epimerase